MKKICLVLSAGFLLFSCPVNKSQAQSSRQNTNLAETFRAAGMQLLAKPVDPIEFSLPLLGGTNAALASYKGKVVLLNFWATWCPPCRAEMPSMEILYKRLKESNLEILAVDCAEDQGTVERFIRDNNYSYPILLDTAGDISSRYGIEAIPTTFILNREGKIITRIVGSRRWDDPKTIAAIEAALQN